MVTIKALSYGFNNPVKETMYVPTSDSIKFKAKSWIDAFGNRSSKAGGATINNALNAVSSNGFITYAVLISLSVIGIWVVVAFLMGQAFCGLAKRGQKALCLLTMLGCVHSCFSMESKGRIYQYICSEIIIEKDNIWFFGERGAFSIVDGVTFFEGDCVIKRNPASRCQPVSLVLKGTWILAPGTILILDGVEVYQHKDAVVSQGEGSRILVANGGAWNTV
jgi:hypothetical protein